MVMIPCMRWFLLVAAGAGEWCRNSARLVELIVDVTDFPVIEPLGSEGSVEVVLRALVVSVLPSDRPFLRLLTANFFSLLLGRKTQGVWSSTQT
jgi:hypothetical protein